MAAMDAKGQPLSGNNDYVMKFDQEPPVGAFWSVTVYDAKTKMLVENAINRYSINNSMPLKRGDDGSFEIHLSNQALSDDQNWLPIPEGEFYLLTRLYVPSQEILRMEWTVPGLEKVQQ
ncbi:putative exported protein [Vibrio variabilis]|uniref:Exported protein n=1 Tax=Vibrio variabilis TaxID=990271 RepID=A0ABQ0JLT4_9VIBR|nr:putative exported protein [Vibrio variabilis]